MKGLSLGNQFYYQTLHTYRESASPEKLLEQLLPEIKLSALKGSTLEPEKIMVCI
jgi:hypothetical protein